MLQIGGKFYTFYHRQTNRYQYSRQTCAEEVAFADGKFLQAEMTSCGLNNGPLEETGSYPARIACNLMAKNGTRWYIAFKGMRGNHPYFTQDGADRDTASAAPVEGGHDAPVLDQYIANFCNGATAGFKYFAFKGKARKIRITLRGRCRGQVDVSAEPLAVCQTIVAPNKAFVRVPVNQDGGTGTFEAEFEPFTGVVPLNFTFRGKGRPDFIGFELE
jgi:hypothetical protein